jgi:hypothetical protein
MKKNILFIALSLLVGSTVLTGCKKGENDPFLSFKSRDARITELWKLVKVEGTENNSGTISTTSYDGNIMTNTFGSFTDSYSYSLTIEIKKDGTYQSVEINDGDTETVDGRWYWNNSAKNKTSIRLDNLGTFEVNGLKSKELILRDYSKEVSVSGGSTDTYESTTTWTFEKQ